MQTNSLTGYGTLQRESPRWWILCQTHVEVGMWPVNCFGVALHRHPITTRVALPESREELAHKLGIVTKEMRETRGWLRFIIKTKLQPESKLSPLLDECEQLLRMLSKSVLTAKLHPNAKRINHEAN